MLTDLHAIRKILAESTTIAIVGLSPKEDRPSNRVARYLLLQGYTIFPVNPGQSEILGLRCYPSLREIQKPVDIVDIFRQPTDIPAVVQDAIEIHAKVVWMQEGISHEHAATTAKNAGIQVVMNRCIKTDHENLLG